MTAVTWINNAGGDWSDSANWSPHLPSLGCEVMIATPTPQTITIADGTVIEIQQLRIKGDSLSLSNGNLTVDGAYAQTGGSLDVSGEAELTLHGPSSINGNLVDSSSFGIEVDQRLVVSGSADLSGGSIQALNAFNAFGHYLVEGPTTLSNTEFTFGYTGTFTAEGGLSITGDVFNASPDGEGTNSFAQAATIENVGKAMWSAGELFMPNGNLVNDTHAVFIDSFDGTFTGAVDFTANDNFAFFQNNGLFRKTDGTGITILDALSNNGTIEVDEGSVLTHSYFGTGSIIGAGSMIFEPAADRDAVIIPVIDGGVEISDVVFEGLGFPESAASAQFNETQVLRRFQTKTVEVAVGGAVEFFSTPEVGTFSIDSLSIAVFDASADIGLLIDNGAIALNGKSDVQVSGDYINANSGFGNAFNPDANIGPIGDGIHAVGSLLEVEGNGVQDDGGRTATIDFGSYHVGDVLSRSYDIANAGPATTTKLRGAIQTNVNGGNITDAFLSGPGVTPQNFGPIAGGAAAGPYNITLVGAAGAITGQTLEILTNFNNVPGKTIAIEGMGYNFAHAGFDVLSGGSGAAIQGSGRSFTLNLGDIAQGSGTRQLSFDVLNDAAGPADTLSGQLTAVLSAAVSESGGPSTFSGLDAGQSAAPIMLSIDTSAPGRFSADFALAGTGAHPGFDGAIPTETFTITGDIVGSSPPSLAIRGMLAGGGH
jgi:hypothetical protein